VAKSTVEDKSQQCVVFVGIGIALIAYVLKKDFIHWIKAQMVKDTQYV
jgi:hypothetical protein